MLNEKQKKNFEKKIDKGDGEGCWLWTASEIRRYGRFKVNGKTYRAHRVAYAEANEMDVADLPEGMLVLHSCDDPACVNPSHLRLGTHDENMQDMVDRGRGVTPRGEVNVSAKLTEAQVIEIRERWAERSITGLTQRQLAKDYGVAQSLISLIVNRKIWTHLP